MPVITVSTQDQTILEQIIDRSSLGAVTEALARIAFEKAEHIVINWQDKTTAKSWERDGNKLMTAFGKIDN